MTCKYLQKQVFASITTCTKMKILVFMCGELVFAIRNKFLQMCQNCYDLQIHAGRGDHSMHGHAKTSICSFQVLLFARWNLQIHIICRNVQNHLFAVTWDIYLHVFTCKNMFPIAACTSAAPQPPSPLKQASLTSPTGNQ